MTHKTILAVLTLAALPMAAADAGPKLRVAVQFRSAFDIRKNCEGIAAHLRRLAGDGVQVAVFPECALTGYDTGPAFAPSAADIEIAERQLQQICRDAKIAAVIGTVYKVNGRAYDAAVVFDSHGAMVERYGKVYLAGEEWATPGNHVAYFELEGVPSTVIICAGTGVPGQVRRRSARVIRSQAPGAGRCVGSS
jgi:predicted amidohydrolase